ncbi:MAG: hypothetical protein U0936_02665 [Planctomycetaceae bacterium]
MKLRIERYTEELNDIDRLLYDGIVEQTMAYQEIPFGKRFTLDVEVNLRKIRLIDSIDVGISINTDDNLFVPRQLSSTFFRIENGTLLIWAWSDSSGSESRVRTKLSTAIRRHEAKVLTRGDEFGRYEIVFIRENAPARLHFRHGGSRGVLHRVRRSVSDSAVHGSDKSPANVPQCMQQGLVTEYLYRSCSVSP